MFNYIELTEGSLDYIWRQRSHFFTKGYLRELLDSGELYIYVHWRPYFEEHNAVLLPEAKFIELFNTEEVDYEFHRRAFTVAS